MDQIREKLQELKQSSTVNQRKYEELDPSVGQAKLQGDSIKNQLGGIETKIKQLESSGTDSLAMFGRTCAKVDRLVKQAHREKRWTGPVAGPIGAHIMIASGKDQFAPIAEIALGNVLGRFVVTNDNDRKLLQRIREQADCPSNECGIYQVAESTAFRRLLLPMLRRWRAVSTLTTIMSSTHSSITVGSISERSVPPRKSVRGAFSKRMDKED